MLNPPVNDELYDDQDNYLPLLTSNAMGKYALPYEKKRGIFQYLDSAEIIHISLDQFLQSFCIDFSKLLLYDNN